MKELAYILMRQPKHLQDMSNVIIVPYSIICFTMIDEFMISLTFGMLLSFSIPAFAL